MVQPARGAGLRMGSEAAFISTFVGSLQQRRALHARAETLSEADTRISVAKICAECSTYLVELSEASAAIEPIGKIEMACRRFLRSERAPNLPEFHMALRVLRTIIGEQIAVLSAARVAGSEGEL